MTDSPPVSRRRTFSSLVPIVPILLSFAVACTASMCHPRLSTTQPGIPEGVPAPPFNLPDAHGGNVALADLTARGPVLIIFYMGYSCPHCVAHLKELAEREPDFDKINAQIVAISPMTIAETKDSIKLYGDLPFPLLTDDPKMTIARAYGMVENDKLFHGAVVIDQHGAIRFSARSDHPFENLEILLDNVRKAAVK